jgi:hypothetical protein
MTMGRIAGAAGRGLVAGMAGTAAMTGSQMVDARLRDREPSTAPVDAAEKVLDIRPTSEGKKEKVNNLVHWAYGTAWGVPRALLGAAPISGRAATGLHFALVWGTAMIALPALRVSPPPQRWGVRELVIDGLHHALYAAVVGTVVGRLARGRDR